MGLFGKILAHSAGEQRTITCKTCGRDYHGNIDRRFPYAVCGQCLSEALENTSGQERAEVAWECKRRENLW